MSYSPGSNRSRSVPIKIDHADGQSTVVINQALPPKIDRLFVSLGKYRFTKETPARVVIDNRETTGVVIIDAVQFISDTLAKQIVDEEKDPVAQKKSLTPKPPFAGWSKTSSVTRVRPPVTPKVMSVEDEREPADFHVLIRGNVHNLGDEVTRGFLRVLDCVETAAIPEGQSGRRELAEWICSSQNPLTARVVVQPSLASSAWCRPRANARQFRQHRRNANSSGTA